MAVKNLQEATERICELKGSLVALEALVPAVIEALGASTRARLIEAFDAHAEAARTVLVYADVSDVVLATFERDIARDRTLVLTKASHAPPAASPFAGDAWLLATTCVTPFAGPHLLPRDNGFFFRSANRYFLVSDRHVFGDSAGVHCPDRVEFGVHLDPRDLTQHCVVSLPLYGEGLRLWREAGEQASDIAVLEIPADRLPAGATLQAFDDTHLETRGEQVATGDALSLADAATGFHDGAHQLAVARSASIASAYGMRFRGRGCFLTDARTGHRSSGSPVMRRRRHEGASVPSWQLIGVHSTRVDLCTSDALDDEPPGLRCAWYADVLPGLVGIT